MRPMLPVVTCLALILHYLPFSHSFLHNHNQARLLHSQLQSLQQDSPLSMKQKVDHFNSQDNRTFRQRYYELLAYFVDPHGPIFLEVYGESACEGIGDTFYLTLAEEMNAAYVTLEHRYYGESIPTRDLSTKNLAYLSTGQALFDLANFRNYYQGKINTKYNLSEGFENAWVVLGGSYAGALSAWFRVKFPHLVRGSISSSGVINSIENYQAYDQQVGESMGSQCGLAYMEITRRLEKELKENKTYVESLFDATQVQNGRQDVLCKPILDAIKNGTDLLEAYKDALSELKTSTYEINHNSLANTTIDAGSGNRQWFYQQCSEVGLFPTAAPQDNVFMHSLNLKYWLDLCASVFGDGIYPNTNITNLNYGATKIAGSRILFLNGSQDPWRHASKNISTQSEESILITCSNCAHCVDITGCYPFQSRGDPSSCSAPENVINARNVMRSSIKEWVGSKY